MEKKLSKISVLLGFWISLIGYSFWGVLWNDAFYHLIALSFVFYTFAIFNECTKPNWRKVTFLIFIASMNNYIDEMTKCAIVFDWTEYLSFAIVAIYSFRDNIKLYFNKLL